MAGLISTTTLEQIRAASDIVDVIGGYVPLKKAGANFTALCPFHKEKSPSFNVNPHRQIFHCFGCHKGGDVFTFVKEYENIGFMDAVRRLAERAKIPLEFEQSPGQQQTRHLKDKLLQIHEQIAQRWQNALANEAAGQIARDYLARRGVSAEAIKLFQLGCAPNLWDDTVNWAKSKGHELALVEKSGLILRKEGGSYYDRFRGRLMFPICDEQGRVIGFSGRILTGDEKTAKYVNSPETPLFTKSRVFFGLDKSKRALLEQEFAIICEGQLDLIACYTAGVQNVVAPQGTALTADHASILKRYVNEVVLCFDSDDAGQNAAVRSLDSLLASGLAIRVALVPAPHDPDSFIKQYGGDAFRQLIAKAEGFFDYYLNRLCRLHDATSDKGRIAILKAMAEIAHKTNSDVMLQSVIGKVAGRFGISPDAVRLEILKLRKRTIKNEQEVETISEEIVEASPSFVREFTLLKLLLQAEDFPDWIQTSLDLKWIENENIREILRRRLDHDRDKTWEGIAAFVSGFEASKLARIITEALTRPFVYHADGFKYTGRERKELPRVSEQLEQIVTWLRNNYADKRIAALMQRANDPNTDDAQKLQMWREQGELRQIKRRPLIPTSGVE